MLLLLYFMGSIRLTASWKCIYESCNEAKAFKLNVHIIPHTHDDVGWVRTVDQYYFGSWGSTNGVQHILNSVINELLVDERRKFTYVETIYFWRWYQNQSPTRQRDVRGLVRQGRLQFAGGAWSMNDEATTHYQSIIDQFTLGLRKLNSTFGPCAVPKAGWQIDPFGHSREFASLLAGMGYDGLFLGRIDYQDKKLRKERRAMEMLWRGSDDLGRTSDIFTSVLVDLYNAPKGYCFDVYCGDTLSDTEIKSKVSRFVSWVRKQAKDLLTNNVLVTMGGDFNYLNASKWYRHLDKLIQYTNRRSLKEGLDVNVFYSTPNCYLKAVKTAMPKLPIKQDDFFPYGNEPKTYWTGFYTSRPTIKYFERRANAIFQMVKQLQVLANLTPKNWILLENLASVMGVMQHHDAITGTEKQYVANDYVKHLHRNLVKSLSIFNQAYNKISLKNRASPILHFNLCALNESRCDVSENTNKFVVAIYNPLPWVRMHIMRVPVANKAFYEVKNAAGDLIRSTVQPIFSGFLRKSHRIIVAEYELVFSVKLQPLGYKAYYVSERRKIRKKKRPKRKTQIVDSIGYTLHSRAGFVLSHGVKYYPSERGSRCSGAYIFKPKTLIPMHLKVMKSYKRHNFFSQEQLNILSHNVAYIHRINNQKYLPFDELEWVIGPIDINDGVGKEFILTHSINIKNHGVFYTDSNGRQMIKRIRNKRGQWNATVTDPVSGNYYPITNAISLQNDDVRFTVLTDRSSGGTSLNPGELEIMVHRRLVCDDGFGVQEALNEVDDDIGIIVRGTHKFLMTPTKYTNVEDASTVRRIEIEAQYEPIALFADARHFAFKDWLKARNIFSAIDTLDIGVHILSLEPWQGDLMLLRLENILSKEMGLLEEELVRVVDLTKLFKNIRIISAKETLLAANDWIYLHQPWEWETQKQFSRSFNEQYGANYRTPRAEKSNYTVSDENFNIHLGPKQIRTFITQYEYQ